MAKGDMVGAPTVNGILDRCPVGRLQISTALLCGTVLILDGFNAQSIGFLAPSMAASLHVSVTSFGPIFGAALVGIMIAAMLSGPIADRWGRKWTIIVASLTFGVFTVLTANAGSFNEVLAFRFLTGLGLGAALPNAVALTSEYAPKRLIPIFVTMLFCGMPAGALLASSIGALILPRWGWQPVLYVGGFLPFVLALVLIKRLPESVRFLSQNPVNHQKIRKILAEVVPDIANAPIDFASEKNASRKGAQVVISLFTNGRATGTILLWVSCFMNLLIIYFIVSWLPALLQESQMPRSAGTHAIILFSLGGIMGSLVEGRLMASLGAVVLLGFEFGATTLLTGSLAFTHSLSLIMLITFILGVAIQGAQAGLNALAAGYYPTSIRSTGVGWALGIGRIGSIVGPVLTGDLLSIGWSPRHILLASAVPSLLAALSSIGTAHLQSNPLVHSADIDPEMIV